MARFGHGDLLGAATAASPGSCPARVMEDGLSVSMSEGTLCDLTLRCASHLAKVEQHIKKALIDSSVIQRDETGLYVAGQRQWMQVTCTPTLTRLSRTSQPRAGSLGCHRHLAPFSGNQRP